MKKGLVLAVSLLSVFSLASCGEAATDTNKEEVTETEESTQTFTVKYYDGDTLLKEQAVKAGETFETYVPEKEGYTFLGWYATPSFSRTYDMTKGMDSDVSLFASFSQYVEDTRTFYIVGSGTSPVLSASNWGKVFDDTTVMTKSDKEGVNEYTYTVDLAEGDQFQFALNDGWDNQRGAGYLAATAYEGEECMKVQGSVFTDKAKKSNIEVLKSGNYTFTLTTYPAEDYYDTEDASYTEATKEKFNYSDLDKITFVRNGDADFKTVYYDYYIKGETLTGWESIMDDQYKMTNTDGIYTLTIELAKDEEVMFYSINPETGNEGASYLKGDVLSTRKSTNVKVGNGNIVTKENGTYTFTYDTSTKLLIVTYSDVYTGVSTETEVNTITSEE